MVALRYFLGASTVWQTEFVTFAVAASTFISAPYVLLHRRPRERGLVVPLYVPRRLRFLLALFGSPVSLTFYLVHRLYGVIFTSADRRLAHRCGVVVAVVDSAGAAARSAWGCCRCSTWLISCA